MLLNNPDINACLGVGGVSLPPFCSNKSALKLPKLCRASGRMHPSASDPDAMANSSLSASLADVFEDWDHLTPGGPDPQPSDARLPVARLEARSWQTAHQGASRCGARVKHKLLPSKNVRASLKILRTSRALSLSSGLSELLAVAFSAHGGEGSHLPSLHRSRVCEFVHSFTH